MMEDKDFFGSAIITVCIIAVIFTLYYIFH
jgi:hypothetical protein